MSTRALRVRLVPPADGDDADRAPAALCDTSDDDLMLMASGGTPAAFDELIRRYQARAIGTALRQTGSMAIAREIAQETFVEVFRSLPSYAPRGKFSAYLFQILINRCRMEFRRRERERRATEAATQGASEEAIAMDASLILERERERRVRRAISRLSEPLREVIALWGEGFKDKEISEILGKPIGTVRRRRFDAVERLRQTLGGE